MLRYLNENNYKLSTCHPHNKVWYKKTAFNFIAVHSKPLIRETE